VADDVYTFHFHRSMMVELIQRLDLQQVTLVCQDWGGLLGFTIPPDMPERFERLIVMNTTIATGESPSPGFDAWKAFSASQPDMDVAALMKRGTPILTDAEAAAYGAPFPDVTYKAGVRRFPEMVMVSPSMEGVKTARRAAEWWSREWHGDTFMAIGSADPVLGPPVMEKLRKLIKDCPEPMVIEEAGHFVQEWGAPVAKAALKAFGEI
jgi:pimeloyl-ACP methyl ester carboxylesterase